MSSITETPEVAESNMLTQSGIVYIFWFLAAYFALYFILGIFMKSDDENKVLRMIKLFDGIIFVSLLVAILSIFANSETQDLGLVFAGYYDDFREFVENPYSIVSVVLFMLMFYGVIYMVRLPMDRETKPASVLLIETLATIVFVLVLIVNFFLQVLKIDLLSVFDPNAEAKKAEEETKKAEEETKKAEESEKEKDKDKDKDSCETKSKFEEGAEVFNIRNNIYTYDEAKEVCALYDAKLADYDQVEQAYNNGGEWCNYGWSEGRMALFPTQKSTWSNLQKNKRTKNACGRPGVNGGYFKNKNIRFGVNCYGKKPKPTEQELAMMKSNIDIKVPESPADRALRLKTEYWKKNADKFLVKNSFNKNDWSTIVATEEA